MAENGRRANEKLVKAIAKYILWEADVITTKGDENEENKEEVIAELKRYKREFRSEPDYNWYRYGNILPYYSQIRDFYKDNGFPANDDNELLCEHFCYHVGKAIDRILAENK